MWAKEGSEDGRRNLDHQIQCKLERKRGATLERETQLTRMRKSWSWSSNQRLSKHSELEPGQEPELELEVLTPNPKDGSEVRMPGMREEVYKISRAAVFKVKQRVQLLKPAHPLPCIF